MADKKSGGAPMDSERNTLQQARPRESKRALQEPPERSNAPVNAIERAPVRQPSAAASPQASLEPGGEPKKDSAERVKLEKPRYDETRSHQEAMPEHIRRRFVQVGRKYYFPDGVRAFTDRGHRLTTASENTEVIKSLVEIAKTRGWAEISVHGSEQFRREAWMNAKMLGLEVRGYQPTEFEESKLVRAFAEKNSPARRAAVLFTTPGTAGVTEERGGPRFVGKLLEHGRAPYKQDPKEAMSYFVRLQTVRGERTVWGVDLERAFKESLTQPKTGDEVRLVSQRRDAVKINVPARDAEGQVSGQKSLDTHRNRWIVEKEGFFEERAQAAKALVDPSVSPKQGVSAHPELIGTYLQVKVAELVAKRIKNPADRQQFVARVRDALAESVAMGEPLPKMQMKDKASPRRVPVASEQPRVR